MTNAGVYCGEDTVRLSAFSHSALTLTAFPSHSFPVSHQILTGDLLVLRHIVTLSFYSYVSYVIYSFITHCAETSLW